MVLNIFIHSHISVRYLRSGYFIRDSQSLEHSPLVTHSPLWSPQTGIEEYRQSAPNLGYQIKDLVNSNSTGNYF